jgi:hypothetical protein
MPHATRHGQRAHAHRPIDHALHYARHQSPALHFRGKPNTQFADAELGLEDTEHHATDEDIIEPDPVDPATVAGLLVGIAL